LRLRGFERGFGTFRLNNELKLMRRFDVVAKICVYLHKKQPLSLEEGRRAT
jgi:hypothetical protein